MKAPTVLPASLFNADFIISAGAFVTGSEKTPADRKADRKRHHHPRDGK